jgi:O-antigen/teichoic acid export membrane protein
VHERTEALQVGRSKAGLALSASLLTSGAVQGLNVLTGILLARALGPHGRGELTAVMLWPLLLAASGSLGVPESATYYAARRTASPGTLIGTILALAVAQSAVLVGIGVFVLPTVLSHHSASTVNSARLFLTVIPLSLLNLYLMGLLNGLQRLGWFQALRLLVITGTAAGILTCRLVGVLTVRTAVVVYLASNVLTLAVAAVGIVRSKTGELTFDRSVLRALLAYGLKSHSSNVPSMLNERLDQLVISIFLAPARLGLYVIAVTMTSVTNLVGTSVSYVALPSIARLAPGEERTAVARRFIVFTLVISAVFTIPFILFTGRLVTLFFGQAFHGATNVCRVLLVAAVVLSTTRAVGAILKAINRPLDAGVAETLALVVTIAGLAAFLPTMGIMGAGVASLLAYLVSFGFSVRQAARALGIGSRRLLLPIRADLKVTA